MVPSFEKDCVAQVTRRHSFVSAFSLIKSFALFVDVPLTSCSRGLIALVFQAAVNIAG